MRVLALTHGDGSNRTFEKLTRALSEGGHALSVVAWDRLREHKSFVDDFGILHKYILRGGGFRNAGLALWYPLWMIRVFWHLLLRRPDCVWAANFECALPAAAAGLLTGVPFVYYIHDNVCMTYRYPLVTEWLFRPLDAWTAHRAEVIFVPDESRIESHLQRHATKLRVLPNTPALATLRPACRGFTEVPFHVYVNGSLWEHRGLMILLDALRDVPGCRVLVAGSASEPRVEAALNACPQVEFVGRVDHGQALDLYTQCSAVFAFYDPSLPINVHASPTKLYEAMMMGRAIILNREVEMSHRVEMWGIGYTCGYYDSEGLTEILASIVSDSGPAREMGERAAAIFEDQFAWERVLPTLLESVEAIEKARL